MTTRRGVLRMGCGAMLLVGIVAVTWVAKEIIPRSRYGYTSHRILMKIHALRERRPEHRSETLWENCVGWGATAFANICFSETHASYAAMILYERELDEKLKGEVELDTLKWIGERAAKTGAHGERYMKKVHWREQWEAIIRADEG